MINRHLASALTLTGIAVVAACGGGGSGSRAPVAAVPQPSATTGIAGPANGTRGTVSIAIPASSKAAASQRRTQFVSPTAKSVTLTINGSTANYDVSPTSPNCGLDVNGARNCQLPVSVPATTTTATVSLILYNGTAGTGTQLGSGSGSAAVSGTNPFTVAVDVSPIIAGATFSLAFPTTGLPRISLAHAETGTATVTYSDPDGNAIPSNSTSTFVNPVTLSVVDPSNTVSISPTTITNAAQAVTVTYTGGGTILASVTFNATASGSPIGTLVSKTSGYQTTFPLGLAAGGFSKQPNEIVVGSDGYLWFAEGHNHSIGHMNPADGTFNEFPLPGSSPAPVGIAAGPAGDAQVWFTTATSLLSGNIGQFDNVNVPSGTNSGPFSTGSSTSGPYGIHAVGGNMWIALQNSNAMLVAATSGALVSPAPAAPPGGTQPTGVTAGPDGNVWVTGFGNGTILSYSPTSPFALLSTTAVPAGAGSQPAEIVTGPDNALWITERIVGKIGRLVPGSPPIVEYSLPAAFSGPWAIVTGSDGGLWFTASGAGQSDIVRIDPTTHAFVGYQINSTTTQTSVGLTAGPDGNLWMTDFMASSIVRIQP